MGDEGKVEGLKRMETQMGNFYTHNNLRTGDAFDVPLLSDIGEDDMDSYERQDTFTSQSNLSIGANSGLDMRISPQNGPKPAPITRLRQQSLPATALSSTDVLKPNFATETSQRRVSVPLNPEK